MRVVLDFDAVAANRFSGFYAYGIGLLRGFSGLDERPDSALVCSSRFRRDLCRLENDYPGWVTVRPAPIKTRWLENIWRFSKYPALQRFVGDFDVYHCLHHLMPPTAGKPRVLTVHDLRRYKLPELYERSKLWRFETAIARADRFIAVSQSTKDDLCRIFGIAQDKVEVIHLAADEHLRALGQDEKSRLKAGFAGRMGTSLDRFVIAISSADARKNIERTIRAFRTARRRLPKDTKLVIAGRPPRSFAEPGEGRISPEGNVIWTGPVENLGEWLGCADALVFASLYEGFGIPILEAFACGVPVITSNCSSMPEVAGDAGLLVNPYQEQAIAQAIVEVCTDMRKRMSMIKAGLARNLQFSWQRTAMETLKVYKQLV